MEAAVVITSFCGMGSIRTKKGERCQAPLPFTNPAGRFLSQHRHGPREVLCVRLEAVDVHAGRVVSRIPRKMVVPGFPHSGEQDLHLAPRNVIHRQRHMALSGKSEADLGAPANRVREVGLKFGRGGRRQKRIGGRSRTRA